jgi:lysozyme
MTALELLIKLIKRFEGCRLKAYYCPAGVLTCGWGSTGKDIVPNTVWTQEYADKRLMHDAINFLKATQKLCPDLEGARLGAIADFAYNLGVGRLKSSTLRKKLNEGDFVSASKELKKWVNGGGKKLKGLVVRRDAESEYLQG